MITILEDDNKLKSNINFNKQTFIFSFNTVFNKINNSNFYTQIEDISKKLEQIKVGKLKSNDYSALLNNVKKILEELKKYIEVYINSKDKDYNDDKEILSLLNKDDADNITKDYNDYNDYINHVRKFIKYLYNDTKNNNEDYSRYNNYDDSDYNKNTVLGVYTLLAIIYCCLKDYIDYAHSHKEIDLHLSLNDEDTNNFFKSVFENIDNLVKLLNIDIEKLKNISKFITNSKIHKMVNSTGGSKMSENIVARQNITMQKGFKDAHEAYNNMLKSGALAKALRECTQDRLTEKELSRIRESGKGYNRIDLTHNNGVPLSIFIYYNEKLLFRVEAYDNFGSMISGSVDLHLTRGTVPVFLNKLCTLINSLANKVEKGNNPTLQLKEQ